MEKISAVGIEADWKEAFFVLAVLVNGGEFEEAKKYVSMVLRRPTVVAVDECSVCNETKNLQVFVLCEKHARLI